MTAAPVVCDHEGISVVRDDLFTGGTKARFLGAFFEGVSEAVYASPAEGGAQTALAHVARALGKKATIFVAARARLHSRALEACRVGANVIQVRPGYLSVVQARAREWATDRGARLIPFGANTAEAVASIAAAARSLHLNPDEVWCASGSGVLARGLAAAWPDAERHVVQVGRELSPADVAGATIHVHPLKFGDVCRVNPPFPSDPHYDAKAWETMTKAGRVRAGRRVLFWNVTGPARP